MGKVRLEKIDAHLKEELKDEEFRKLYELERVKVALAQNKALGRGIKISFPKLSG